MTAATLSPLQMADPRRHAEMQADLSSAALFRKKAEEWDEAHGFKYHLLTVGLILTTGIFGLLLALDRINPYRGVAHGLYARYERTHDEIAKAHGLPTRKEISRYVVWGGPPPAAWDTATPTQPAQVRKPTPARATLAA